MRILLIGSGGREHALARKLARDGVDLHAAPGNPGIGKLAELHDVNPIDAASVTELAAALQSDLVVIGPEAPLVAGVAEAVRDSGRHCFGPDQEPAMLEGSKAFAKEIMAKAGIPTAAARTCRTQAEVDAALAEFGPPYVVKANGLAAGKGVLVTSDKQAASEHARRFGLVVIEEYLDGPEVSVFALADGGRAIALQPAQDFKRAHDGDEGPNTGGMGAYTPLTWAPSDLAEQTITAVINPAIAELRRRGAPYQGLLYAGLALTSHGVKVIEFNARFGDPETQVILDRLHTPLAGLLLAAATGDLATAGRLDWAPGAAVTVVIAAAGYPGNPVTGDPIKGIDQAEQCQGAYVLHAGTALHGGVLVSSGGRVLNIVGSGPDIAAARNAAYAAAERIELPGGWFRSDIAEAASQAGPAQPGRPASTTQQPGRTVL